MDRLKCVDCCVGDRGLGRTERAHRLGCPECCCSGAEFLLIFTVLPQPSFLLSGSEQFSDLGSYFYFKPYFYLKATFGSRSVLFSYLGRKNIIYSGAGAVQKIKLRLHPITLAPATLNCTVLTVPYGGVVV